MKEKKNGEYGVKINSFKKIQTWKDLHASSHAHMLKMG